MQAELTLNQSELEKAVKAYVISNGFDPGDVKFHCENQGRNEDYIFKAKVTIRAMAKSVQYFPPDHPANR